jgi:hypothetical protein
LKRLLVAVRVPDPATQSLDAHIRDHYNSLELFKRTTETATQAGV